MSQTAIPKQAIDSKLQEVSNAIQSAIEDVQNSVEQRAALEGSTIALVIGTDKDGFTSLTNATTKGATAEGPAIAKMGGNINEGNITKTVSNTSKLSSVTGGSKGTTAVLNETIVQASVKGMAQGLIEVANVSKQSAQTALPTASPIPSLAQAAMRTELEEGGIATKAGINAQEACARVSSEIENPFGSNNVFGGVGSLFGNILGQITALAVNAPSGYQSPKNVLKSSSAITVLNRANEQVPTPIIINSNGTTNLQKSVIKSKLENSSIPENKNILIAGGDRNWKGINTDISDIVGNQTAIEGDARQQAEISQIEREIRQVIIVSLPELKKHYTLAEIHLAQRKNMIRDNSAETVNANPNDYALPAHVWIEFSGLTKLYRPFNEEVKLQTGNVPARPGAFYIYLGVSGSGGNKDEYGFTLKALEKFLKNFLVYYPGVEILGVDDINSTTSYTPNPFFDVRDWASAALRKASTFPKNEIIECPPASDLAVRRPSNIIVPKRNPNALPNVSKVVTKKNISVQQLSPADYLKNEAEALSFIKQKKDAIISTDLISGNGLAGTASSKITSLSNTATDLLKKSQSFKLDQLEVGKVFDSVKGIFK